MYFSQHIVKLNKVKKTILNLFQQRKRKLNTTHIQIIIYQSMQVQRAMLVCQSCANSFKKVELQLIQTISQLNNKIACLEKQLKKSQQIIKSLTTKTHGAGLPFFAQNKVNLSDKISIGKILNNFPNEQSQQSVVFHKYQRPFLLQETKFSRGIEAAEVRVPSKAGNTLQMSDGTKGQRKNFENGELKTSKVVSRLSNKGYLC